MTHIGHSGKVLVMRVFIAVLVLIFSFQSLSSAKYIELLKDGFIEGQLRTICYDQKDKNLSDLLYVVINSKEFVKFLDNN